MSGEICDHCGGTARRFEGETFVIEHEGLRAEVPNLSGWRCEACGETDLDTESTLRYAAASDRLVLAARKRAGTELRRIRKRLGLSQEQAAKLTGGGHNAFSRYERGEAPPMPAVVNLFRLLDRHPDLLTELTPRPADAAPPARAPQ
jgi:HTH-type transcriptional regulator / antitoxin MqsA